MPPGLREALSVEQEDCALDHDPEAANGLAQNDSATVSPGIDSVGCRLGSIKKPYGLSGAVPFKNRTIAGSPVREDRPRNSIFLIALALLFRIQHAFERGIEHLE